MLNSGKKIRVLRDKKKYSNSCVVRKKNSERNTKKLNPPPFKLNGRSLTNSIRILDYITPGSINKKNKHSSKILIVA
jgi:hypothetical protein